MFFYFTFSITVNITVIALSKVSYAISYVSKYFDIEIIIIEKGFRELFPKYCSFVHNFQY